MPVLSVREAVSWYATRLGGSPATYFHRPAVEFPNGTAIVFEPRAVLDSAAPRIRELGFLVDATAANPKPKAPARFDDPWGTPLALFPSDAPHGLAHVALLADDIAGLTARISAIAGHGVSALPHAPPQQGIRVGDVWVVLEPTPEGGAPGSARIGFAVDRIDAARQSLSGAGATDLLGPARFSDLLLLHATLVPGLDIELSQPPPAADPENAPEPDGQ